MRGPTLFSILLTACFLAAPLRAEEWDAATMAIGWAHQDKDDSFTFFDEFSASLRTWSRDAGLLHNTPLGQMPVMPEKWVIDPHDNHWVISGLTLIQVSRSGLILKTSKLPAEVSDIGWDAKGFVLSYRTPEPYLEKRDYNGALLWSYGVRPAANGGPTPPSQRPLLLDDAGNVLVADGNSLNLTTLDGATGRKIAETRFLLQEGKPAPTLEGAAAERGPLVLWPGKGVVLALLKATQIPAPLRKAPPGLVLARLDLRQSRVEFLPTGLDEAHLLIGVLDSDAIFVNPKGGLMLVKVQ